MTLCVPCVRPRTDYAALLPYLRAYQKFERLLDDPAFCYRVALQAGDFLAYDNSRMLHARTAFSGNRWLRGVYFMKQQ